MMRFVSIGECMLELASAGGELWRLGIAGDTLNTAWYARACLPSDWAVAYGTCIGTDEVSQRIPKFLAENGIGTDRVLTHPTRSVGLYLISLTKGERSFSYWRETSAARTLADDPDQLLALTAEAQILHVSGITLAILPPAGRTALIDVLRQRKSEGAMISFDPNLRPKLWENLQIAADTLTEMARVSTVVLPSFDDERRAFGDTSPRDTINRYAALGAESVVVKNGGAEVLGHQNGETQIFDHFEQVEPVDTTGAGDSFNGAFLAAIATGAPLAQAVGLGHQVAAQVIGQKGALIPMETIKRQARN
ncbi:sugar kinase [Pseudophaeobacter arcticus]|uniref:sugar kinase n=1 Tax=Pseudophaeobacter arcticus TaxID=385492 RepID=UPI003A97BA2B